MNKRPLSPQNAFSAHEASISGVNNPYNYFFLVLSLSIMGFRSILSALLMGFLLFLCFSCTNRKQARVNNDSSIQFDLPPEQKFPVLRILDYKNRNEGGSLAPWLRSYLENGISESESLALYQDSYLFIASIRSLKQPVIDLWVKNYFPDRDFSRLVAGRIRKKMENNLSDKPPDFVYGPNYENALYAAFRHSYWGALQADDSWILAVPAVVEEETPQEPYYWGFILISIPRETLEIQIVELLSKIVNTTTRGGRSATKEQNEAFNNLKDHFFEQF